MKFMGKNKRWRTKQANAHGEWETLISTVQRGNYAINVDMIDGNLSSETSKEWEILQRYECLWSIRTHKHQQKRHTSIFIGREGAWRMTSAVKWFSGEPLDAGKRKDEDKWKKHPGMLPQNKHSHLVQQEPSSYAEEPADIGETTVKIHRHLQTKHRNASR